MAEPISITVMKERMKTVTITTTIPRTSIPSCWIAANPPPKKMPSGNVGFPEAVAKVCCVKKAIVTTPNNPPTRCPGNNPTGSENHLNFENHHSPARYIGPPIKPRITALAGLTKPARGVMMINPIRTPLTA